MLNFKGKKSTKKTKQEALLQKSRIKVNIA